MCRERDLLEVDRSRCLGFWPREGAAQRQDHGYPASPAHAAAVPRGSTAGSLCSPPQRLQNEVLGSQLFPAPKVSVTASARVPNVPLTAGSCNGAPGRGCSQCGVGSQPASPRGSALPDKGPSLEHLRRSPWFLPGPPGSACHGSCLHRLPRQQGPRASVYCRLPCQK